MSIIMNKYGKWYFRLIKNAQSEHRSKKNGYFESHHIIPKSFGGSNEKTNLVLLTAREHFIAHLILVRCVEKKNVYKMLAALIRFKKHATNSRSYDLIRSTLTKFGKGDLNPSYGKIWIHNTNTIEIKYVKKEELESMTSDWVKGLPFQRGGMTDEYIWFYKGDKRTAVHFSKKEEYLKDGWILGRNVILDNNHYRKMSKARHTKEKDTKHSKTLTGRIAIRKPNETSVIRVLAEEVENYLTQGYILHKNSGLKMTTSSGKECMIMGVKYRSVSEASQRLEKPYSYIYRRILRKSYNDWYFI